MIRAARRRTAFSWMRLVLAAAGLVALVAAAAPALARSPNSREREIFQRGNAAYEANDFARAVAAYEELVHAGLESRDLYYNLANAHLKAGQLGPAILFYRRALRLGPGDADARANLEYARRRTQDARPREIGDPFPWLSAIRPGPDRAALLFVFLLNGAALLFAASRFVRDPPAFLGPLSGTVLAMAVLMALVFFWELRAELSRREGVVQAAAAEVRTGPGDSYTVAFQIHEGTEVQLGRSTNGWTEISVTSELKGWVGPGVVEAIP